MTKEEAKEYIEYLLDYHCNDCAYPDECDECKSLQAANMAKKALDGRLEMVVNKGEKK